MTNNSDGLTPTLRPQLGVGWNRALPSPFGFENGFFPDGTNDYLVSRDNLGVPIDAASSISVEFWYSIVNTISSNRNVVGLKTGSGILLPIGYNGGSIRLDKAGGSTGAKNNIPQYTAPTSGKHHVVLIIYYNSVEFYIDTLKVGSYTYQNVGGSGAVNIEGPDTIRQIFVGGFLEAGQAYFNQGLDEVRLYNRALTQTEVNLHYNGGVGENPSITENLIAWYKMNEFKALDFSSLQDGSDYRTGIVDEANKRHLQPINCDINPASSTYVLKPF